MENNKRNKIILLIAIAVIVLGSIAGYIYWAVSSSNVYVENSTVSAPVILLLTGVFKILLLKPNS